ncbi:hypothetical protein [Halobacteriovorax sp. ZH2_bin.1]|uniref:hypothetical protein n=1 Tax=unclassified Halobacteriovorax TaxID=2639665 RepID=UPI0037212C43
MRNTSIIVLIMLLTSCFKEKEVNLKNETLQAINVKARQIKELRNHNDVETLSDNVKKAYFNCKKRDLLCDELKIAVKKRYIEIMENSGDAALMYICSTSGVAPVMDADCFTLLKNSEEIREGFRRQYLEMKESKKGERQ